MSNFFSGDPVGRPNIQSNSSIGTSGGLTGVTVTHKQWGPVIQTTLTLAAHPQAVVDGVEYQSSLLWTFPTGDYQIQYVNATLAQTTTSAILTTLNAGSTGAVGVGTTAAVSTTLATTTQNLIPTTAFTSSATINVAGTAVTPKLGTGVYADFFILDGDPTAQKVYLNSAFATTGDVDGNATMTWAGSIVIVWQYLGGVQAFV
jgi:hypothetical protein